MSFLIFKLGCHLQINFTKGEVFGVWLKELYWEFAELCTPRKGDLYTVLYVPISRLKWNFKNQWWTIFKYYYIVWHTDWVLELSRGRPDVVIDCKCSCQCAILAPQLLRNGYILNNNYFNKCTTFLTFVLFLIVRILQQGFLVPHLVLRASGDLFL